MCHLERAAVDFYYDYFAQKGSIHEDAETHDMVKKKILAEFEEKAKLEEEIHEVVTRRLETEDIGGPLVQIDAINKRASFNETASSALLREPVAGHLDFAQFVMYRAPWYCKKLKKEIEDFQLPKMRSLQTTEATRTILFAP